MEDLRLMFYLLRCTRKQTKCITCRVVLLRLFVVAAAVVLLLLCVCVCVCCVCVCCCVVWCGVVLLLLCVVVLVSSSFVVCFVVVVCVCWLALLFCCRRRHFSPSCTGGTGNMPVWNKLLPPFHMYSRPEGRTWSA